MNTYHWRSRPRVIIPESPLPQRRNGIRGKRAKMDLLSFFYTYGIHFVRPPIFKGLCFVTLNSSIY